MRFPPNEFLTAMEGYRQRDPELALVLGAVKMTVKGGIGKLREKARGGGWRPGQGWPAPARPTWRPDIRAVVISRARISMHRKMLRLAAATGRYPVAVLSDCAVYAADGPGPLDVLPYDTDGKTVPGSFRLGVSPGMVKHEGTQTVLWGGNVLEQPAGDGHVANPTRDIKTGEAANAACARSTTRTIPYSCTRDRGPYDVRPCDRLPSAARRRRPATVTDKTPGQAPDQHTAHNHCAHG